MLIFAKHTRLLSAILFTYTFEMILGVIICLSPGTAEY